MPSIHTSVAFFYWFAAGAATRFRKTDLTKGPERMPSPEQVLWTKVGGIAALFEAFAYIFGLFMLVLVFNPETAEGLSATERLSRLLLHQQAYDLWITVIYLLFGIALVPLVGALERQWWQDDHPLVQCSTVIGYVWVVLVFASGMIGKVGLATAGRLYSVNPQKAGIVWTTIEVVQDALGGGVEIVGGLWVLLVSLLALREEKLTRFINITGLIVGAAGVLTIVHGLAVLGMIFGLVQILWFISLGYHLLRIAE